MELEPLTLYSSAYLRDRRGVPRRNTWIAMPRQQSQPMTVPRHRAEQHSDKLQTSEVALFSAEDNKSRQLSNKMYCTLILNLFLVIFSFFFFLPVLPNDH